MLVCPVARLLVDLPASFLVAGFFLAARRFFSEASCAAELESFVRSWLHKDLLKCRASPEWK